MFFVHQIYRALHIESSVILGIKLKKKSYRPTRARIITYEILGPRGDEC